VVNWFQPGAAPEAPLVTELRRLSDGAVVQSLSQEQGGGTCYTKRFAFSPDGRRLASVALDGNAAVWDVSDGRLVASGRLEPNVITLGWSPDSRLVVTGGISGQLRMWDPAHRLRSDATVALSDNSISGVQPIVGGDRLVATVESGEIWVVDLGDEETVGPPFRWGGTQLQSGALSPDGRLLAAVSRDGTLRLWDARRHAVLGPALHAFERGDQALVTFTGSNELVGWDGVGLNAGQALRWHVDVDTWIDTACRLAGRPLTEEEWSRYIPEEPFAPACGEP